MHSFRKYTWLGLISARSNLAYLGEVVTRTLFLGVILFIFLQLWRVTYSETGAARLGGLTLAQMLWYLAMTEAITLSVPRISQEVDQDVRTGALAVQLIRPLSYPLSRLWTTLGERVVRFLINAVVGAAIALALVGPIGFTAPGLGMFALALLPAFALEFLGQLLIGLCAFWMEDTTGLALIYSRVTMILGGMLIPLELFPPALQPALRAALRQHGIRAGAPVRPARSRVSRRRAAAPGRRDRPVHSGGGAGVPRRAAANPFEWGVDAFVPSRPAGEE